MEANNVSRRAVRPCPGSASRSLGRTRRPGRCHIDDAAENAAEFDPAFGPGTGLQAGPPKTIDTVYSYSRYKVSIVFETP